MSKAENTGNSGGKPPRDASAERAERLAAALRENLKRRKAQARGRANAASPAEGAASDPAPKLRD